jgi:hypothetical protein
LAGLEARSAQRTTHSTGGHHGDEEGSPGKEGSQGRTQEGVVGIQAFLTLESEDTMSSDNITLIRAAKPTKKDLPAGKDVKGGKKMQ